MVCNKVLTLSLVIEQILIFHPDLQINSLKIRQCDFLRVFFLILSLIVEVYLWWKLQASLIFLCGRTRTIDGWLSTFMPHCSCVEDLMQFYKVLTILKYDVSYRCISQNQNSMKCSGESIFQLHLKCSWWSVNRKKCVKTVAHDHRRLYTLQKLWHNTKK